MRQISLEWLLKMKMSGSYNTTEVLQSDVWKTKEANFESTSGKAQWEKSIEYTWKGHLQRLSHPYW